MHCALTDDIYMQKSDSEIETERQRGGKELPREGVKGSWGHRVLYLALLYIN